MGGGCKALLLPVLALAFLLPWQGCSGAASRANVKKPLPSSTAVFPIRGNVYPDGLYYVTLLIGDPPKPYFLDVDTGSDITWLQCNAPCVSCSPGLPHPLYKPKKQSIVPCNDPVCKNLPSGHSCHDQCDYEIEYADHFSSLGVLVRDDFSVQISNSSFVRSNLAFGCGYDQRGSDVAPSASTDGMLGLGSGKSTIVSQLSSLGLIRNMIGHCFSLTSGGGGYLFFGDGLIPPRVTWTPMFDQNKNYAPGPANLLIGNLPSRKGLRVVFDSGSSYTYFTSQAYKLVVSSVTKDLSGKFKESPNDGTLPLCWKGPKRIKHVQEMNKYMKTFGLRFGNRAQLDIPPEGYLIISSKGNVCLGILNGTEVGLDDINLIGDVSMQNTMIIYDNENRRIGWSPADCDRLPNAEDEEAFVDGLSQPYPSSMGLFVEDGWFLN